MNYSAKQITGVTMVILGAGYLLMQLMVFAINTSTYMN